jgi:hypothetical protein
MSNTTSGTPAMVSSASDSCMSERPCPVEPVAAGVPVAAAPHAMPIASSSLSAFMQTPPTGGIFLAICSRISVKGVIG